MMAFRITRLDPEPVHIIDMGDFDIRQDVESLSAAIEASRDGFDGPFYEIMDVRDVSISFSDVVLGFAKALRTEKGEIKRVPSHLRRQVFVANNDLVRLLVRALGQAQYGSIPITIVDSMEDALHITRDELDRGGVSITGGSEEVPH